MPLFSTLDIHGFWISIVRPTQCNLRTESWSSTTFRGSITPVVPTILTSSLLLGVTSDVNYKSEAFGVTMHASMPLDLRNINDVPSIINFNT